MREHGMADGLVCHWRMVTDENGRGHMEALWAPAAAAAADAA